MACMQVASRGARTAERRQAAATQGGRDSAEQPESSEETAADRTSREMGSSLAMICPDQLQARGCARRAKRDEADREGESAAAKCRKTSLSSILLSPSLLLRSPAALSLPFSVSLCTVNTQTHTGQWLLQGNK